jgi:hypothetical protein
MQPWRSPGHGSRRFRAGTRAGFRTDRCRSTDGVSSLTLEQRPYGTAKMKVLSSHNSVARSGVGALCQAIATRIVLVVVLLGSCTIAAWDVFQVTGHFVPAQCLADLPLVGMATPEEFSRAKASARAREPVQTCGNRSDRPESARSGELEAQAIEWTEGTVGPGGASIMAGRRFAALVPDLEVESSEPVVESWPELAPAEKTVVEEADVPPQTAAPARKATAPALVRRIARNRQNHSMTASSAHAPVATEQAWWQSGPQYRPQQRFTVW